MDGDRGQAGLDRLLLFVVALVALLALLPVALGAAGVDTGPAPGTLSTADGDTAGDLVVLGATGGALDGDSVGRVDVAVTAVDGPVPVSAVTVTLLDADPVTLRPAGSGAVATVGVTGADGTVDPGDRAVLTVDLGTDDVAGVTPVGQRLRAGGETTLVVAGPNGSRTVTLSAPETVAGDEVSL